MNLSETSTSETITRECDISGFLGGKLDHTTTEANAVLVFLTVMNITTCPFTIALNLLVMIAVKTKERLKTNSNIALGCLALTDALMGVIGQPAFAAVTISTLQGDTSHEHSTPYLLSRIVVITLATVSISHIAVISVERYVAIKHPFTYPTIVTKARVLGSSALAWITVFLTNMLGKILDSAMAIQLIQSSILFIFVATIVFCQISVYKETHHQEKQIAAHQISVEARQKFLKEKKALKLTTTVLFLLFLCYLPVFFVRILIVTSTITNVNMVYISFFTAGLVIILNSVINPIIYCARVRQFRVAFIQILLRKNFTQAEQFERGLFGTLGIVAPLDAAQQREAAQKNAQESLNNNYGDDYKNGNNNDHNNNNDEYNNDNDEDDDNNNNDNNDEDDDDDDNKNNNKNNFKDGKI